MPLTDLANLLRREHEARRLLAGEMIGGLYPSILAGEMRVIEACFSLIERYFSSELKGRGL
jgi:hypothetical protein